MIAVRNITNTFLPTAAVQAMHDFMQSEIGQLQFYEQLEYTQVLISLGTSLHLHVRLEILAPIHEGQS
jgi:hypothetical protein